MMVHLLLYLLESKVERGMPRYEPVIGLEIHAQIHTASKMFCSCPVVEDTGTLSPNTYTCPICAGFPGSLPTINRRAVELGIMTGLALNCCISPVTQFARKSYYYPDLPKGYQISQHAHPLAKDGYLDIPSGDGSLRIGIDNVHLEEDTGKLYHREGRTLVDLNRAGVGLVEIVTLPELHSAKDASNFAASLRLLLIYLGLNSGDMEKGVMRFEASVSLRREGSDELNPRHEIKNLNSFRALTRAVTYDIDRQTEALERGEQVSQQTLGWDEARGKTVLQRGKESAADYRYFPEPDLLPIPIDREWVDHLLRQLPELPQARRQRFISEYGLGPSEADVLVSDQSLANYYETVVGLGVVAPKEAAPWIVGDLLRLSKEIPLQSVSVYPPPEHLADLIDLVQQGDINVNTGRLVLEEMVSTGREASQIIRDGDLTQISDEATLREVASKVLADHPRQVQEFLEGKHQVVDWLMGQVMKDTRDRADPDVARSILLAELQDQCE